ncbi:MAG TPA: hypothetical protein VLA72_16890 [Anaerolineales bacterium]|nr:hypothetical protein [Anaerolineales bacterium]
MKFKNLFKSIMLIVILALASISCGVSDLPFLATETPTPTATYTPSPTSTPTQTPTSTPTNTPSPTTLPTGVTSEEQVDGSTLFVDYDNKYQMILPVDWVIIPFEKETIANALDVLADENPHLASSAEAFKELDPNVIRMIALNTDLKYLVGGSSSNITVAVIDDAILSALPLSFVTDVLEESFTQQGINVLTSEVNIIENDHGVEVEYIDIEQRANNEKVLQRIIVFKTSDNLMLVTITTLQQFEDEIFPISDQIGVSIEIFE